MKSDAKYPVGELIVRFYRKRTASFLVNIYKAGITGSSRDIHRARLDVKKIFAIADLLRIVRPKKEKDPGYEKIFKKLYRASERIREIQVNQVLITGAEFARYDLLLFSKDLECQEKELTKEFLRVIRKFDEKKLSGLEKRIIREVGKITHRILQHKTNRYIDAKTAISLELLENAEGGDHVHEVRQHIKELSTVLTLIFTIKPSGSLEKVINGLNKSEMMIGDWHDKVILAGSLSAFLEQNPDLSENQLAPARECYTSLAATNKSQIESILLDVRKAIAESML